MGDDRLSEHVLWLLECLSTLYRRTIHIKIRALKDNSGYAVGIGWYGDDGEYVELELVESHLKTALYKAAKQLYVSMGG